MKVARGLTTLVWLLVDPLSSANANQILLHVREETCMGIYQSGCK